MIVGYGQGEVARVPEFPRDIADRPPCKSHGLALRSGEGRNFLSLLIEGLINVEKVAGHMASPSRVTASTPENGVSRIMPRENSHQWDGTQTPSVSSALIEILPYLESFTFDREADVGRLGALLGHQPGSCVGVE